MIASGLFRSREPVVDRRSVEKKMKSSLSIRSLAMTPFCHCEGEARSNPVVWLRAATLMLKISMSNFQFPINDQLPNVLNNINNFEN
jgi:hypothetical protein